MKKGVRENLNRKFKLKATHRYEGKRMKIRLSASSTREAIERELTRRKSTCDTFLDFCLIKAEQLRNRLDPEGKNIKEATYECKFCLKKFAKSTALGGHISKVHKEQSKAQDGETIVKKKEDFDEDFVQKYSRIEESSQYLAPYKIARVRKWKRIQKTEVKLEAIEKKGVDDKEIYDQ